MRPRHLLLAAVAAFATPAMAQKAENALTSGFTSELETLDAYATAKRTSQPVNSPGASASA
jgi:peptide/nickel transport system substrate-binding protein